MLARISVSLAITALTILGVWLLQIYVPQFPVPAVLYSFAILFAGWYGGCWVGLACAALCVGASAIRLAEPGIFLGYSSDGLIRLILAAIMLPLLGVVPALLTARANKSLDAERVRSSGLQEQNTELGQLRAALDRVSYGVALIDSEFRTRFTNRAFRELWELSEHDLANSPPYVALIQKGRAKRALTLQQDQEDEYVRRRIALIRDGDGHPIDLRLKDNGVVRFQCAPLPDGGRMLTYTNITDLVTQAEELGRLATMDDLSGLSNRRHFMASAEREWNRCRRYRRPLSLVMIDIDLFKSINDTHGHGAGDSVIAYIGHICRNLRRDSDTAGRLGGEEFALLLPETTLADALSVAERLRAHIATTPPVLSGRTLTVTVSAGVATAEFDAEELGGLVERADRALYEAKHRGRNRSVIAEPRRQPLRVVR